MDSEPLLKFIGYFPDYLSAWSRTLLRLFWTIFAETAADLQLILPSNTLLGMIFG